MNILIVDDEEEIREILTFTFETEITAEFFYAESGNDAIKCIDDIKDIDLIICDYNMSNGTGADVYKHLVSKNIDIPYVLCSSSKSEEFEIFKTGDQFLGEITKPYVYEGVSEILKNYKERSEKEDASISQISKNKTGYSTLSLDLLLIFTSLPSDIYVRINEHKMVKVLTAGDALTQEEVEKYKKKNIKKLLIKMERAKDYFNHLSSRVEALLGDKDIENEDRVLDVHTIIMDTVRNLGLSTQIVRATEKSVEFAVDLFTKNRSFDSLSKHIFGHGSSYLTKHSIALSYISTVILSKLPWDSPETRNKLVMASFLHDASIKRPDFNEAEVDIEDPDSLLTFKTHPQETVDLLKEFKALPPDVDTIILEHHERPDGSGVPKQLSAAQIKPLSSIFIFAHDIVDIIFFLEKHGEKPTKKSVFKKLNADLYNVSSFKKSYEALNKVKLFKDDE